MQQFDQDRIPDEDREYDFKNLIAILAGRIQLKTVEPGILSRLDHLDSYYDLLPFNVRGFRLINRASLLDGDFAKRYIIKQTIDLNLDLENDFRKHYLIELAVSMVKGVPTWSFFVSLILLSLFLLQVCLDSILYNLLTLKLSTVQDEYNNTTGPTANDEQTLHNLKEELIAIWFLYVLLPLRLGMWFIDLVIRYIGLRYFRKEYTTFAMFMDFVLGVLTMMIVGFSTRLDYSLKSNSAQTQIELVCLQKQIDHKEFDNFFVFFGWHDTIQEGHGFNKEIVSIIQLEKGFVLQFHQFLNNKYKLKMTDNNIENNQSIQSYMGYSEQRLMHEDSFLKQKDTQEEEHQEFEHSESQSQHQEPVDPMLQQNEGEEQEIQPIEINPLQLYENKKNEIIQMCQKNKTLFTDPEFPTNNNSLYKDPQKPPEFAKDIKTVKWVRPHEIQKDAKFVIDFEGDYKQGAFGESWFVGAVVIVGQMKKYNEKQNKQQQQQQSQLSQLEKLILDYEYFDECGFVTFQFFKNGEWRQVIVDTLLPFDQDSKQILFTQCANPSEFWLPLMEKAYCKLHGNYETICEGHIGEGLVDLTGGIAEINSLRDALLSKMIENDQLWQLLLQTHKLQFYMGCMNHNEAKGTKNADTGTHGILENHHYGIVDVREFPKEKLRLMRIRNVWGPEGGWNGAFSDDSEEWDKHRNLREELKLVFKSKKSDGTWWMSYQDWHQHFNKFYICKVFPENWQQYAIQGQWAGKTMGGVCPQKMPTEGLPECIQVDTDEKWFNNPQFRIRVHKESKIYLSLMLEDEKINQLPYVACNMMVIANKARLSRIWERPPNSDIIIDMNPKGDMQAQREITQYLILKNFEGKNYGSYMVVPNMIMNENRKEEKRNFILRIFSSDKIDVAEMPETLEIQQDGSWTETTSGGKRKYDTGKENPNWCKNPQYFLNLTVSTHLKIILRRQGQVKRAKGTKLGMTICRFDKAPTNTLNIIKQQKGGGTNLARLLKQTQQQLEAPQMVGIQRKLLIGSNEKFKQSTYFSEDVAALYFHFNPTEGPFIIIPSLDQEDRNANYKLTIYSNQEVELVKLDETRNQVLIGKWEQDISDGGCHLYEDPYEKDTSKRTWTMNPKYSLQFLEPIHITITLCIAEKNWKSKTKNTVGGMIGVYLIEKSENKITTAQIVRQPNFLPINEIQEQFDLQPTKSGYYIMPTTYQSKIHGQFILAVQGDKEFQLQALK